MGIYFGGFATIKKNINQVVPQGLWDSRRGVFNKRYISMNICWEGNYPVEKDKLMTHGNG